MILSELLHEIEAVIFLDGGPHLVKFINLTSWRFSLLRRRYSWFFLKRRGRIDRKVVVEYFFDGLLEVFDASVDAIAFVVEW
jgi:nucleoid-associated protein YejK